MIDSVHSTNKLLWKYAVTKIQLSSIIERLGYKQGANVRVLKKGNYESTVRY